MADDLAPRHLQLREFLLRRWKTAGLKVGDRIESQNEITRFCEFSLITVIKTLKDLEAEGVIERQVGRGSFLKRLPWAESYKRIGLFYNREIVGGGIFQNAFYTRVVAALESNVVSGGHSFVLGSFTHNKMPIEIWDRLDAVILTGITNRTSLEPLQNATSVIAALDAAVPANDIDCFRIDMRPAFDAMFASFDNRPRKILYLDSAHASSERQERLTAFMTSSEQSAGQHEIRILQVDQENPDSDLGAVQAAALTFQPDIVCGYIHPSWSNPLREMSQDMAIYRFTLEAAEGGFYVNEQDWIEAVIERVYAHIDDRNLQPEVFKYPARFVA